MVLFFVLYLDMSNCLRIAYTESDKKRIKRKNNKQSNIIVDSFFVDKWMCQIISVMSLHFNMYEANQTREFRRPCACMVTFGDHILL